MHQQGAAAGKMALAMPERHRAEGKYGIWTARIVDSKREHAKVDMT